MIVGGVVTGFPDWISDLWARVTLPGEKHTYSRLLQWWIRTRDGGVQPFVVYSLSVLVMIAVTSLVVETGGIVGSPFVPFLTAPALFGPFVAKGPKPVGLLVTVVAVTIAMLGHFQKTEQAYICKDPPRCNGAPKVTIVAQAANAPEGTAIWLYCGVGITLIAVAGNISRARLKRERRLEAALKKWRADVLDDTPDSLSSSYEDPKDDDLDDETGDFRPGSPAPEPT